MYNVTITRSLKRTTLTVRITPEGNIAVSAPYFLPKGQIEKFLKEKDPWIQQKLQIINIRKQEKKSLDNETYLYLGRSYQLELGKNQKQLIEVRDKLYVGSANKKYIKTYLTSWYKQQARKIIVERVQFYARISGATYKSINLTSAETRWGSCSSEKSLNFNWRLIMAPIEVIDYVVTHELAHLKEMNHSRDFWETVRKMFPLYRQYRTWLKRYGHTLRV